MSQWEPEEQNQWRQWYLRGPTLTERVNDLERKVAALEGKPFLVIPPRLLDMAERVVNPPLIEKWVWVDKGDGLIVREKRVHPMYGRSPAQSALDDLRSLNDAYREANARPKRRRSVGKARRARLLAQRRRRTQAARKTRKA